MLPADVFYIRAFWDLSSERQVGMGAGPIPYFARRRYALEAGLEPRMIRPFIEIIAALDAVYLNWTSDQIKSKGGKASGGLHHSDHRRPLKGSSGVEAG